jgi:hypothetical protein
MSCNTDFTKVNVPVNNDTDEVGRLFNNIYTNTDSTVDICVKKCDNGAAPLNMYALDSSRTYDVNNPNSISSNGEFNCYTNPSYQQDELKQNSNSYQVITSFNYSTGKWIPRINGNSNQNDQTIMSEIEHSESSLSLCNGSISNIYTTANLFSYTCTPKNTNQDNTKWTCSSGKYDSSSEKCISYAPQYLLPKSK